MNKRPALLALAAFLPFCAYAQPQKQQNLDDISVVIQKSKDIVLPIEEKPLSNRQQNLPKDSVRRDYSGLNDEMVKPTNVLDLKPRVLNFTAQADATQKPNYLKLGVGNYLTTHLEGLYTHGNKEDYIAAKVLHFNSALGSEKWQAQGVNQLDIFGTYKALKGRVKANLLVENNRNTLYSFIPESADSKSDIRISNLRTGFDAGYAFSKANKYDLDLALTLNAVSSFESQKSYFASVGGKYTQKLGEDGSFGIKPGLAVNKISSTDSRTSTFFDLQGDYTHKLDALTVRPWLKFMYENDKVDKKNVHLYPGIEATYTVNKNVNVFGTVYSDYSQNLFFDQVKVNPWVDNIAAFSYLNMPLALALGAKASSANYGIEVNAGLKQYKNYVVYAPHDSTGDKARFYALNLQDEAVTISYLNVTGSYRVNDNASIETGLLFQNASSSFKPGVPNVPAVTWRLAPAFRIQNFTLVPTLVVKSSYDLLTPDLKTTKSGAMYDLAAKLSYNLSHRINLNLDLYNLANNKPYLYYGYRQRGALVVLGGTLKF